jgi:hypothetical protein
VVRDRRLSARHAARDGLEPHDQDLLHAFGFCGHGFQLSPGVGYTLAEMIDEGQARIPIEAFAIDRFAKSQPDQERLTGEFDAVLASAAMAAQS